MLTNTQNTGHHAWRQWMTLPLFLVAAVLFMISCQSADRQPRQGPDTAIAKPTTVIPDNQVTVPDSNTETGTPADTSGIRDVRKMTPPKIVRDQEVKEAKQLAPPKIVKDNEPEIYSKVDQDARYPGDWARFLTYTLRGEVPVEHGAGPGNYQVIAQFIVDTKGNVSDVKLIKDPGFGMGAEALRVIKQSGKWQPAMMHGKPVKAYRKQPITFQVTEG